MSINQNINQNNERAEISQELKWDLTALYPSLDAWQADLKRIKQEISALRNHRGHLSDSAAKLYSILSEIFNVRKNLERISDYSMQLYDEDTRISANLEMCQYTSQLSIEFSAAISWLNSELLVLGEEIGKFLKEEPKLHEYSFYLNEVLRSKDHTLSEHEEKIIIEAGDITNTGSFVFSVFNNADFPYPEITLSTGEKIRLDSANYSKYSASKNREERKRVDDSFLQARASFSRALGSLLYSQIKAHKFNKTVRKFNSSLESALFKDNIPKEVYSELITNTHRSLPSLHWYLKLLQRMLKLPSLHHYDLYEPSVPGVSLNYTPQQAMDLVIESVKPLGVDYARTLKNGFANRWVDFMPTTGKRSGAYSTTSYGVHPFQLLNYTGTLRSVSMLAHESGHSMHSYLSNSNQPYVSAGYSIFIAEVASTLNENLLWHYMLSQTIDEKTRMHLLFYYLEHLRQVFFRQVLLAEFELDMHQTVEQGGTLTGEILSKKYLNLLRKYYGEEEGICKIDDIYAYGWSYIPHFYYNFYVYQYATSVVASIAIAKEIRNEQEKGKHKVDNAYLNMLKSGGSKYPIELLKDVGVDMTTRAPFDAAIGEMNKIMDEVEAILNKTSNSLEGK
jgi:oligoendopeptidase F